MVNKIENSERNKTIIIEFLFLDLETCERCMETESNLDDAIDELEDSLKSKGIEIGVVKVDITTKELAEEFKFKSSPTIRVNGHDILGVVKENSCTECSDVSGTSTNCRIFEYEGKTYNDPPKAMIVQGILKAINNEEKGETDHDYTMPENIEKFFLSKQKKGCGCSCGNGGCSK